MVFYRFLCVVILKLFRKSTKSKQKQFCDHVPHIIVNPGKSSEISKQYHVRSWLTLRNCNSVWWTLSCTFYWKLYILQKIVHFTENCTFHRKLYILPKIDYIFNQKLEHWTKNCTFNQKLNILLKIVHLTKNWTFHQKFKKIKLTRPFW